MCLLLLLYWLSSQLTAVNGASPGHGEEAQHDDKEHAKSSNNDDPLPTGQVMGSHLGMTGIKGAPPPVIVIKSVIVVVVKMKAINGDHK